jgi:hypothetical protein
MSKDYYFQHRLYLTAATVTGFGCFAMTAAVLSGNASDMHHLVVIYSHAFNIGTAGLLAYAICNSIREEDD